MMLKIIALLGLIAATIADNLSFEIALNLEDDLYDYRYFIVDTTSTNDFVLDATYFRRTAGKHNTFNPDKSENLEKLSRLYGHTYTDLNNDEASSLKGMLAEDALFSPVANVRFRFGVVNTIGGPGNPAKNSNGNWTVGRVGLDRNLKGQTTLKRGLFELVIAKCLCGSIVKDENSHIISTHLGRPASYYKDSFIVTVPADTTSNLWTLPSVKVSAGTYQPQPAKAVLSTTLDALNLPATGFDKLVKELGAVEENGQYYVKKEVKLPNISVEISGKVFSVTSTSYTEATGDRLRLKLRKNSENIIVLGTPFLINNGFCLDYVKNDIIFFQPSSKSVKLSQVSDSKEFSNVHVIRKD